MAQIGQVRKRAAPQADALEREMCTEVQGLLDLDLIDEDAEERPLFDAVADDTLLQHRRHDGAGAVGWLAVARTGSGLTGKSP